MLDPDGHNVEVVNHNRGGALADESAHHVSAEGLDGGRAIDQLLPASILSATMRNGETGTRVVKAPRPHQHDPR